MKTAVGAKGIGGVGARAKRQGDSFGAKRWGKFGGGFGGFWRWVSDRYDFWVVHRGERLKPEVWAELEEEERKYEAGNREGCSPVFDTAEDAIAWLNSRCKDEKDEENSV